MTTDVQWLLHGREPQDDLVIERTSDHMRFFVGNAPREVLLAFCKWNDASGSGEYDNFDATALAAVISDWASDNKLPDVK